MKRYDMQNVSKGWEVVYEMVEVPGGEWVRYEDAQVLEGVITLCHSNHQQLMDQYMALKAEHEKVKAENEALREANLNLVNLANVRLSTDITDSTVYVSQVADHCDRIVWRGHYYHLPLETTRAP